MVPYYTNEEYIIKTMEKRYEPPESFLHLDKNNIIQCENIVPIFYHNCRQVNICLL